MPRLLVKANQLNALACVFGVLFSESMERMVLRWSASIRVTCRFSNLHDCPSENPSQTSKEYHLPYLRTESE